MTKRFFILTDEEYDTRPCIRDRTFKIKDIYGDYKYDDLEGICNEFNRLNDENEQLKQKIKSINEILNEDIGYIESLRKIEEALK